MAAHPTNSAASDKIFVSGQSGVFAMLTNDRGVWSEFGLELPNALVRDLDYDAADDVLVVGTLGRGAWLLPNANEVRALEGSPLLWVPTLMTP